ncbi:MAG: DGQHR domain-containing protein, partial [Candidatus Woesearchaeota archaeon]
MINMSKSINCICPECKKDFFHHKIDRLLEISCPHCDFVSKKENFIKNYTKNTNKSFGTKFEEKIKHFLEKLEFNDVDGARDNFLINGIQVDVCGSWENALLVIECRSKQELGKRSLRSDINEFRGKIPLLIQGFKEHPTYKKYTFLKFILVIKNIKVRKPDINFANERPSIYIWDDNFFEYYTKLYDFIKPYAKFNLLGEMRIKPVQRTPITIPAFKVKYGKGNVYTFVMNPKDLLELAFVARREVKGERYYQRIVDKKRLLRIAKYIERGGTFPNNIIISFDKEISVKFHPLEEKYGVAWPYIGISFGILEFPKDYRSCWIIDGQHRLYAFMHTNEDIYFNMPITAFENLDIEDQCRFFLDINKNQKPVDADLLWDLNGEMISSERDGIISNTVKFLNDEERGPLFFKIYYPSTGIKKKTHKIKISALCIAIKKNSLVNEFTKQKIKNPLYIKDHSEYVKNLGNSLSDYFEIMKLNFPNNWDFEAKGFILTNGGIAVMIGLFEKIVSRIMEKSNRKPNKDEFKLYTNPLKEVLESSDSTELKKLRLRSTSEGGKSEVLNEFVLKIRHEIGDDKFGGEIPIHQYSKQFSNLEKKYKLLIKKILFDPENKNWFEDSVDKSIYGRILTIMKKNGVTDVNKAYLYTTLGDCIHIMRTHSDKFYPIFLENEKFSFINKVILEGSFSLISIMRAKLEAHYTG